MTAINQKALSELLDEYESSYMASGNLAPRTRTEYLNDLQDLVGFLGDQGITTLGQTSLRQLEEFKAEMDRRGLAGSTRRRKVSAVRSFFRFLHAWGYTNENLASRLIPPRRERREPRFLTEQEYKRLLDACRHQIRDAAIIEVLLQTGIRLSELANLKVQDIELPLRLNREATGWLFIHQGKGRKDRTIALNYKACRALNAYLKVRPDAHHDYLFVSKFGGAMTPRGFQHLVAKYVEEAGIPDASVHTLRHTFATQHVARGTNLRVVQEALGHEDLKSTAVYVGLAKAIMRKELQEHAL